MKGHIIIEDVAGQKPGGIPGTENTVEMPGSGDVNFNFTPPTNGWPSGKYKFEALMLNENGEQKDSKSQEFTVN